MDDVTENVISKPKSVTKKRVFLTAIITLAIMIIILISIVPINLVRQSNKVIEDHARLVVSAGEFISELQSILSDYSSLGDKDGTITIINDKIVFSPMLNAKGLPSSDVNGPLRVENYPSASEMLSPGVKLIEGYFYKGPTLRLDESQSWCVVISNGKEYIKSTDRGVTDPISDTPLECKVK